LFLAIKPFAKIGKFIQIKEPKWHFPSNFAYFEVIFADFATILQILKVEPAFKRCRHYQDGTLQGCNG